MNKLQVHSLKYFTRLCFYNLRYNFIDIIIIFIIMCLNNIMNSYINNAKFIAHDNKAGQGRTRRLGKYTYTIYIILYMCARACVCVQALSVHITTYYIGILRVCKYLAVIVESCECPMMTGRAGNRLFSIFSRRLNTSQKHIQTCL